MSYIAAKVGMSKQKRPENYCPVKKCLWRTRICDHMTGQMKPAPNCEGGYCPRHQHLRPRNV